LDLYSAKVRKKLPDGAEKPVVLNTFGV